MSTAYRPITKCERCGVHLTVESTVDEPGVFYLICINTFCDMEPIKVLRV